MFRHLGRAPSATEIRDKLKAAYNKAGGAPKSSGYQQGAARVVAQADVRRVDNALAASAPVSGEVGAAPVLDAIRGVSAPPLSAWSVPRSGAGPSVARIPHPGDAPATPASPPPAPATGSGLPTILPSLNVDSVPSCVTDEGLLVLNSFAFA